MRVPESKVSEIKSWLKPKPADDHSQKIELHSIQIQTQLDIPYPLEISWGRFLLSGSGLHGRRYRLKSISHTQRLQYFCITGKFVVNEECWYRH